MKIRDITAAMVLLGFLLGVYQGKVALWKEGDPEPIRIFPYQVEALPKADQQALEKGIRIETKKDLLQLLEDYLS